MSTKHVAPSGNNANDGNSLATAYRDIGWGISQLASGDTLMVYGTGATRFDYAEGLINPFPTAYDWAGATKVHAAPGENVWLTPPAADYVVLLSSSSQTYIEFSGINIDASHANYGAIKIEAWANGNPHHIRFQQAKILGPANAQGRVIQGIICDSQAAGQIGGNEFRYLDISNCIADDFTHGIYIKSGGNIVDSCNIYYVTGACIHLYASYLADGNIITRNRLHDITPCGAGQRHWGVIVTDNCPNTKVIANVLFNIPNEGASSCGILVSQNASGAIVDHNTVTQCPGVGIQIDPTVTGAQAFNNLSYGNAVNFALAPGDLAQGNNLEGDPSFIDPSQNNFQIQPTSAACKAGTPAGVNYDNMYAPYGNPPSVGAYEPGAPPPSGGGGELDEGYQEPIYGPPPPVG